MFKISNPKLNNLINIAGTKIQNTKIIDSEFKNSRMMSNILKNTLIENINLAFSEFINTSLCNIDLSICNIEKIKNRFKYYKRCNNKF